MRDKITNSRLFKGSTIISSIMAHRGLLVLRRYVSLLLTRLTDESETLENRLNRNRLRVGQVVEVCGNFGAIEFGKARCKLLNRAD